MAINKIEYGNQTLIDLTDTTATASDVASGKYFYTNAGVKTLGTASGGGGGGDLEYEEGTWSPSQDVERGEVSFVKTHTKAPCIVVLSDATGTNLTTNNSAITFFYENGTSMFGQELPYTASSMKDAHVMFSYRASGTATSGRYLGITDGTGSTASSSSYWATSTAFYPYCNSSTYMWRSSRTYKWIAIWK